MTDRLCTLLHCVSLAFFVALPSAPQICAADEKLIVTPAEVALAGNFSEAQLLATSASAGRKSGAQEAHPGSRAWWRQEAGRGLDTLQHSAGMAESRGSRARS